VDVVQDGVDAATAYSVRRVEPTTHTTHNKDASCPEASDYVVPQSGRVAGSAGNGGAGEDGEGAFGDRRYSWRWLFEEGVGS
jgi:hypothetical protein